MRPIKLTISAFGPYADKQVIDFEQLNGRNIFVISGKTGAGKTTIFDAISYALYGEASGESREVDSLRSHFADEDVETFVELEFELKGERYTINRCPKQKKKKQRGEGYTDKNAEAKIDLPNGKLITGVNNVTNKIVEILGINRNQFKQIVMLAQGEFKKLLLADSKEREEIFRKIFDTYEFEKIQQNLKDKAIDLSKNRNKSKDEINTHLKSIKGNHDILIGEYIDFPFVIEKLKEFIEIDSKNYKNLNENDINLKKEIEVLNNEKITIENNNNLLKEKDKLNQGLQNLLNKEKEYKEKKEILKKCIDAKEIRYIEDNLIESKNILVNKTKLYEDSKLNIESLDKNLSKVKYDLKIEEEKEPERDKLKLEIKKLEDIKPKILELDNLKVNLENKKINIKKVQDVVKDNKNLIENFKKEKVENEIRLKEIFNLETKKVELQNEIKNREQTISETRELFKIIDFYEKSKIIHENSKIEYINFEKDYKQIKKKYEDMDELYKKEQAGILAYSLKENEPCPVCGSKVHPNIATINKNLKVPTKEELQEHKEKVDYYEKENNLKMQNLTKLNSDCNNYFETLNNNLAKLSQILNIDKTYSNKTNNEVKIKGIQLKESIENLKKELENLDKNISLKKDIEVRNTEIDKRLDSIEKELENLNKSEKELLSQISQLDTKIEEYKMEIKDEETNIKSIENLINEKKDKLNLSQKKLIKLREDSDEISKTLASEISKSNEIQNSILELNSNIEKVNIKLYELLKEFNFNDFNDYQEYKAKIDLIDNLEKEIENYYVELNLFKAKKEDIEVKTKDLKFIEVNSIEEKIKIHKAEKEDLEKNLRELYSIIDNNTDILKKVENLNNKFNEIENEYKIIGELADLANGKKSPYISFERYILASYFEDIIDAANIRLEKMTGDRFSLIRKTNKSKGAGQKGLELEIYDNYTDSCRDVSSLSGGESFKASLSLALGLSDVVQSSSGGVSLETMFVDEGFGTLDPQSLDSAIDSLLELQRGGRLVGIISHVEELKERMDAKLEVTSTEKGSKVKFNIL